MIKIRTLLRDHPAWQASLLLLGLLLLFLAPALFSDRALAPLDWIYHVDPLWAPLAPAGYDGPGNELLSDQVSALFPWKVYLKQATAAGEFPLWNPYFNGGQPFFANAQSMTFSLHALLIYLMPAHAALEWIAFSSLFLLGLFTYLYAREVSLGHAGGLLAMVTVTFSVPVIAWLGYPVTPTFAWFPVLLWLTERAIARENGRYFWLLALVIALQFFQGHPETSFHMLQVGVAYGLFRLLLRYGRSRRLLRPGAQFLAALAGGVGLAAIQILPTVVGILNSAAAAARTGNEWQWLAWQHWAALLTTLLPRVYGTPINGSYWFPGSNYNEQNLYAGVLPLALALVAAAGILLARRRRYVTDRNQQTILLFWLVTAALALVLAIHAPVVNLLSQLPLWNLAANERLRLIYIFGLALLASFGLDTVLAEVNGRSPLPVSVQRWTGRALLVFALGNVLLGAAALVVFSVFREPLLASGHAFMTAMKEQQDPFFWRSLDYYLALADLRYQQKLDLFYPSHVVMYLPLLVAVGAWSIRRWLARRTPRLAAALIGLVLLDLFLVNFNFNPTIAPQHIFPRPATVSDIQQDESVYRVAALDTVLLPNVAQLFELQDIRGYDPMVSARYDRLVKAFGAIGNLHLFTDPDTAVYDLLNVKYLLTYGPQALDEARWQHRFTDGQIRVYENRQMLPRAFMVYQARQAADADEALALLTDGTVDWRRQVILEADDSFWAKGTQEQPAISATIAGLPAVIDPPPQSSVTVTAYGLNQVTLDVETAVDGILVLADPYAPGWIAAVDGRPAPVWIANAALRSVPVPAGSHQVVFRYDPIPFRLGLWISLASLLLVLATIPFVWRKQ